MLKILNRIFSDLFLTSFSLFIILVILEDLRPGFVTFWFNLNILVWIVILSGLITLFTSQNNKK